MSIRHSFIPIVIFFLSIIALSLASPRLTSHIIRFSSVEARERYVEKIKKETPDVKIHLLDHIFIGAVTEHETMEGLAVEKEHLHTMSINSATKNDIISFEQDQVISINQNSGILKHQSNAPWHLDRIDQRYLPLDSDYSYVESNDPINIYIMDTGVRISHNEFQGRAKAGFSAVAGSSAGEDCHGHGTHVAAITAGRVSGVNKKATIWDVRVLGCSGTGSNSGILRGMDWIARHRQNPAVVNMSLGGGYSQVINEGVAALKNLGVLPIVAAGNENANACGSSPASAPEALTVGSSTTSDSRSSFSNWGSCVDIFAPGSNIRSASIRSDSSFTEMSGTSMASPVVTGVASLILQQNAHLSPDELKSRVVNSATSRSIPSQVRPLSFADTTHRRQCLPGFGGPGCDVPFCGGKLATEEGVCSGHGTCNTPGRCTCNEGYGGRLCQSIMCFGTSKNKKDVCSNHGTCVGPNQCECRDGFTGEKCEIPPTCFGHPFDSGLACSAHGKCVGKNQCECDAGFSGTACQQFHCFDKSPFDPSVCSSKGFCVGPNTCRCSGNSTGPDCAEEFDPTHDPKLSARIEGEPSKVMGVENPLVLDATSSHVLPFFESELNETEAHYEWSCSTLGNDAYRSSDICQQLTFDDAPVLSIPVETLRQMRSKTMLFTMRYIRGEQFSVATNVVTVEHCNSWKEKCGCLCTA